MNKEKSINHMIAGALARVTGAIIMCPADTIKTRMFFQGNLENVRRYKYKSSKIQLKLEE
jgi:hypothetical protein